MKASWASVTGIGNLVVVEKHVRMLELLFFILKSVMKETNQKSDM